MERKAILIVEDDGFSGQLLRNLLIRSDYDVCDVLAFGEDAHPRPENVDVLLRATHSRGLAKSEDLLIPTIETSPLKVVAELNSYNWKQQSD